MSREQERAHFTASAFVINGVCSRTCLVTHAKLGRLLQPGGHVEDFDESVDRLAAKAVSYRNPAPS